MGVAWTAMILWPLICIAFFRNLSLPLAVCISIIGGYLVLPSALFFDVPLLPALYKDNIPGLAALIMTAIVLQQDRLRDWVLPGWLPRTWIGVCLLMLLVFGTFGTVLTNSEALVYGPTFIAGLRPYDGFSMLIKSLLFVLPLLLARKVLASLEGQRTLLLVLAISGAIYCLPALYEVRMSPQLHINLYGYFPHSFLQSLRGGGYRPSVFLNHGLELAMFLVAALFAAIGLYHTSKMDARTQFRLVLGFIFVTLVLVNSLGAFAIALLILPVALFAKQRTQLIVAACIAGAVLTFPLLRNLDLVPTASLVDAASSVSPARAESLSFRFFHEDKLLEKAQQKPVFGWGEWGRSRVFDMYGRDVSVTDGAWVVHFGLGGWVRYLAIFGLLCWPVIGLLFTRRENVDPVCAALALILAAKLLDLVPNGAIPPFIWLVAGSLIGRLEMKMVASEPDELVVGYNRTRPSQSGATVTGRPQYARTFENEKGARIKSERMPRQRSYYRRKPETR